MSFEARTLDLLASACSRIDGPADAPRVRALHLPPHRPDDPLAGESCALELDDGSIGLSYVLFGDALDRLRSMSEELEGTDALALAAGLAGSPEAQRGIARTLGLAAANALTARIFVRTGFAPPSAVDSIASIEPRAGERIGMVGFFAPLVPPIVAAGASLVVVELRADLLGERDGIAVTSDAAALAGCDKVIATGTVLLNGTLDRMRAASRVATRFALVGPSAGLLPDALFAAGVTDIGGSWIEDGRAFVDALRRGERRGRTTRKFTLSARDYPGLPALLSRLPLRPGRQ